MLFGRSTLRTTLRNLHFEASPHAFLQTNTTQAEVLYRMISEAAGEYDDHICCGPAMTVWLGKTSRSHSCALCRTNLLCKPPVAEQCL